jgi:EAL domain-containing protein (putative c-di-GMP-specific phosphodiesterase class I)
MGSLIDASFDVRLPVDVDELASKDYASAVHQLLAVARTQLGMQVAWVSEFVGADQVLRFVSSDPGVEAPREGDRLPLDGSFCTRVLSGRFPALIPDALAVPEAALLDVTSQLNIGSYVGVPLVGPQGVTVGMLCAIHESASPGMSARDLAAVQLLAELLRELQDRALSAAKVVADRDAVRDALLRVIAGEGRHPVLQPIVDITSGRALAAEGLTRFTAPSAVDSAVGEVRSPAQWFDDAARLSLGDQLELAAAASVLDLLDGGGIPSDVTLTVNLGPGVLLGPGLPQLLEGRPLDRIMLELTEHAPISDYDRLTSALRPYREAGLRLAVDDAGAGYASLTHVLAVRPDWLKIDMALTRGADVDLARRTLLCALVSFAETIGSRVVAEGVETVPQLAALRGCGIELAQGFLLARPSASPAWQALPAA